MIKKFEGVDWSANVTNEKLDPAGAIQPATTAPGVEFQRSQVSKSAMLQENEALKAKVQSWDGAVPTRKIPTNSIVRSKYANRHESNFDGDDFAILCDEIRNAGGNVQPIKVRPIAGGKFELVFGHRRTEACRRAKLDVLAFVEELTDQALFVEMDRENRSRKDLSPWEQGVMYKRAIDAGLFPSNKKLSEALGVDLGMVGKALALAALPVEVIGAFQSPLEIQYRFAKPLKDELAKDSQGVFKRAHSLAASAHHLSGAEVFAQLLNGEGKGGLNGSTPPVKSIDVLVNSKVAAKISRSKKGLVEVHFAELLDDKKTEALAEFIQGLMTS